MGARAVLPRLADRRRRRGQLQPSAGGRLAPEQVRQERRRFAAVMTLTVAAVVMITVAMAAPVIHLGYIRLRIRQNARGVALAPRVRTGHSRPHRLIRRAQTNTKSIQSHSTTHQLSSSITPTTTYLLQTLVCT